MSQFKSIKQDIQTSTLNYTETNLEYNAEYTGTGEEVLGESLLQLFHAADQDCTVYIDQSTDQSFTDADHTYTSTFNALANTPLARIVFSIAPYFRLRVKNVDTAQTTTTHIGTYMGKTPVGSVLPTELSTKGNLQVVSSLRGDENYDRHVWVNPTNELNVSLIPRLVGTTFIGTTIDPNFWTAVGTDGGTVTQGGGYLTLDTDATSGSLASLTSVRKGRFVAGSAMLFSCGASWVTTGTTNNVRRIGAYSEDDGYFFQLSGTTFSVGTRAGGAADALINTGSFNGNIGPNFTPVANRYYKLTIEYTPLSTFWYIDGTLLHKIGKTAGLSATPTLPIKMENINTGVVSAVEFVAIGLYIARQGELQTNQTSKFIQGISTTVCKYGAGVVKGIVVSGVVDDAEIDFYDGLTTGAPLLWASGGIKAKTDYQPIPIDLFGLPFSDGLTIDINTAACNVLMIYE